VATFEQRHTKKYTAPQGVKSQGGLVAQVVSWLVDLPVGDREATLSRAVDGFFADAHWAAQGRHPFHVFAKAPGGFLAAAPKKPYFMTPSSV
jgi:hypothetical protein